METQAISLSATPQTVAAPTPNSVLSSDFETFLLMLTTQMENQDPLNPIESSDFAVQLATFSGVEQQVRTNDLLSRMASQSAMADLSRWVGLEARFDGDVAFRGQPVLLDLGEELASSQRTLVVRSADGTVIETTAIPTGIRTTDWAGTASDGTPLPDGDYNMTVEHTRAGTLLETTPVASYSRVVEARSAAAGTEVVLENGTTLPASEIAALRAPDTP